MLSAEAEAPAREIPSAAAGATAPERLLRPARRVQKVRTLKWKEGDDQQGEKRKIHGVLSLFRDPSLKKALCEHQDTDKQHDKKITDQKPYSKTGHVIFLLGPRFDQEYPGVR